MMSISGVKLYVLAQQLPALLLPVTLDGHAWASIEGEIMRRMGMV